MEMADDGNNRSVPKVHSVIVQEEADLSSSL